MKDNMILRTAKVVWIILLSITATARVEADILGEFELVDWSDLWNSKKQDWNPLRACQGDCNFLFGNKYCQDGFECREGTSFLGQESCNGTAIAGSSYCVPISSNANLGTHSDGGENTSTPAFEMVDWNDYWNGDIQDWNPIGLCLGDCGDKSQYCKEGLECRSAIGVSAPCSGEAEEGIFYCLPASDFADDEDMDGNCQHVLEFQLLTSWSWDEDYEDWSPAGLCMGDCQGDLFGDKYCQADLTCILATEEQTHPICGNNALEGVYYCLARSDSNGDSALTVEEIVNSQVSNSTFSNFSAIPYLLVEPIPPDFASTYALPFKIKWEMSIGGTNADIFTDREPTEDEYKGMAQVTSNWFTSEITQLYAKNKSVFTLNTFAVVEEDQPPSWEPSLVPYPIHSIYHKCYAVFNSNSLDDVPTPPSLLHQDLVNYFDITGYITDYLQNAAPENSVFRHINVVNYTSFT